MEKNRNNNKEKNEIESRGLSRIESKIQGKMKIVKK